MTRVALVGGSRRNRHMSRMKWVIPKSCNACGGELTEHLREIYDPQTKERFAVRKCDRCGLGHTVPSPEDLTPYYGLSYYGKRHGFTAAYCVQRRFRILASVMGWEAGRRLLDVGCGDGTFLMIAKQRGWKVVGTEMNPHMARRAGFDVRSTIEDASDYAPFDCITLWHSLEHMRDPKSALMTLSGLLASNGTLLTAVPNAGGLQAKVFRRKWFHWDVPRHLYHFDSQSLGYLLRSCGFSVKRQWHQELEYDLIGWSQSTLNLLLPIPNVFFYWLTGKLGKVHGEAGSGVRTMSILLGTTLSLAFLPAVTVGSLFGRGGTLVIAATLADEGGH